MARLIYSVIMSLDGYIEDATGKFDWAAPTDEVHAYVNDREREVGTYLYGRRMYETMAPWETDASLAQHSPLMADYAEIWQAADKVVYSKTLQSTSTARTRIEREFDPEAVRRLVMSSERDVSVGGAELAGRALKAGLVDECYFYVVPVSVGGGRPCLPRGLFLRLELMHEHRFAGGTVLLHYRTLR